MNDAQLEGGAETPDESGETAEMQGDNSIDSSLVASCFVNGDIRVCSGNGLGHTNRETAKTYDPNNPLSSVSWNEIQAWVDNPQDVPKHDAQWLIAGTVLTRTFREQGNFWALVVDLDKKTKPIEEIQSLVMGVIGSSVHEIYTTASATKKEQKCRILIPLAEPLDSATWRSCQIALGERLGVDVDTTANRFGQIQYLPNRGGVRDDKFYDSLSNRDGEAFDAKTAFKAEIEADRKQALIDAEEQERKQKEQSEKRKNLVYDGKNSPIFAINEVYSVFEMLVNRNDYEWRRFGKEIKFKAPESTTFGAVILDDGKVYSHSDNDPLNDGKPHDAFDILKILKHDGDLNAALIDAGHTWLIMEDGRTWNAHKQEKYRQGQVAERLTTMANIDDPWLLGCVADMSHIPIPVEFLTAFHNCKIEVTNVTNCWEASFYIKTNTRFSFLNKKGELIKLAEKDTLQSMQTTFGAFIEGLPNKETDSKELIKAKNDYRTTVKSILFNHLKTYRQRSKEAYEVDMFVDKPTIAMIEGDKVMITYPHKPFPEGEIDLAIVGDYKEHFPMFDDYLELLGSARFASDRRQAFVWLHAPSNWGKGFLQSIFNKLGIVTEISGKEVEKAFEGNPLGRDAHDFLGSWILWIDEFKAVKSEFKELNNRIIGAPKYQLSFEAPLYLKMFTSAETVDSIAGEKGVEAQFAKRFSYMRPETGDMNARKLFMEDKDKYIKTMANYTAQYLNKLVEKMRSMGKDEASRLGGLGVAKFHKANGIEMAFGSIEASVIEMTNELKEFLIKNADRFGLGVYELPKHLSDHLKNQVKLGEHDKFGRVLVLKSWSKFIKGWIETFTDPSQIVAMKWKAKEIAERCNEGVPLGEPFRLKGGELMRGVMIKRSVNSAQKTPPLYTKPPSDVDVVTFL